MHDTNPPANHRETMSLENYIHITQRKIFTPHRTQRTVVYYTKLQEAWKICQHKNENGF